MKHKTEDNTDPTKHLYFLEITENSKNSTFKIYFLRYLEDRTWNKIKLCIFGNSDFDNKLFNEFLQRKKLNPSNLYLKWLVFVRTWSSGCGL